MISYPRMLNCAQELSLFSVYSLTVSASQGLAQVQTGTGKTYLNIKQLRLDSNFCVRSAILKLIKPYSSTSVYKLSG